MSDAYAFVGDIHGNLAALRGLRVVLDAVAVDRIVFLGDYINKGADSAQVVEELLDYEASQDVLMLAGNHERAMLSALDREDLSGFIKLGGAMTIRSYVGPWVGPDVLGDFARALPARHLELMRSMPTRFETDHLIAQHVPDGKERRFQVSAHVPVGVLPVIRERSARIDTGCGAGEGRLTAFLWPSKSYVQVDRSGRQVSA